MFTLFGGAVTALGLIVAVATDEPVKTGGEALLLGGVVGTITHVATSSSPAGIAAGVVAGAGHAIIKSSK